MLRSLRVGALISAVVLGGLLVSTAGAAEWHTNGPATRTSTNAGAVRLVTHPHGGGAPISFPCGSASVHLALNGPTSTSFPWTNAATGTPTLTGCTVAGGIGFSLVCSPVELRAATYVGGTTFATAGGGVTTGSVTNIDCKFSIGATVCLTMTGTINVHYINPNPISSGAGRLTVTSTGQALTSSQVTPCAAAPPGTVTIGTPGPTATTITDLAYTFDGPNAPYLYRTP